MPWKEAQWPLSPLVLLSARSALLPSQTGCLWVRLCAQEGTCMRKPSECPAGLRSSSSGSWLSRRRPRGTLGPTETPLWDSGSG